MNRFESRAYSRDVPRSVDKGARLVSCITPDRVWMVLKSHLVVCTRCCTCAVPSNLLSVCRYKSRIEAPPAEQVDMPRACRHWPGMVFFLICAITIWWKQRITIWAYCLLLSSQLIEVSEYFSKLLLAPTAEAERAFDSWRQALKCKE